MKGLNQVPASHYSAPAARECWIQTSTTTAGTFSSSRSRGLRLHRARGPGALSCGWCRRVCVYVTMCACLDPKTQDRESREH